MGCWLVWSASVVALAEVLKGCVGGNAEDCGAGGVVFVVVIEVMV